MLIITLLLLPIVFAVTLCLPVCNKPGLAVCQATLLLVLAAANYYASDLTASVFFLSESRYFLTFSCDRLSAIFVLLVAFVLFVTMLLEHPGTNNSLAYYHATLFLVSALAFATFLAADLITFYVSAEICLLLLVILVAAFGGIKRTQACLKMLIYMTLSSLFFVGPMLYLFMEAQDTGIDKIVSAAQHIPTGIAIYLWLGFMISFLIKAAHPPLHGWLPCIQREAPAGVSIFLGSIISKIGYYSIIKIIIPAFTEINLRYQEQIMLLSLITIVYTSVLTIRQSSVQRIVSYSSLSYSGHIMMSIFTMSNIGIYAAMYQIVSHGLIFCGLFVIVDQSRHYGERADNIHCAPLLFGVLLIIIFAVGNLPGTPGFVGLTTLVTTLLQQNPKYGIIICANQIIVAICMARFIDIVVYRDHKEPNNTTMANVNKFATVGQILLCTAIIACGIFHNILPSYADISILMEQISVKKISQYESYSL